MTPLISTPGRAIPAGRGGPFLSLRVPVWKSAADLLSYLWISSSWGRALVSAPLDIRTEKGRPVGRSFSLNARAQLIGCILDDREWHPPCVFPITPDPIVARGHLREGPSYGWGGGPSHNSPKLILCNWVSGAFFTVFSMWIETLPLSISTREGPF